MVQTSFCPFPHALSPLLPSFPPRSGSSGLASPATTGQRVYSWHLHRQLGMLLLNAHPPMHQHSHFARCQSKHTECISQPLHNISDVAELIVSTQAPSVSARIAARRAFAVRILNVLPNTFLQACSRPMRRWQVRKPYFGDSTHTRVKGSRQTSQKLCWHGALRGFVKKSRHIGHRVSCIRSRTAASTSSLAPGNSSALDVGLLLCVPPIAFTCAMLWHTVLNALQYGLYRPCRLQFCCCARPTNLYLFCHALPTSAKRELLQPLRYQIPRHGTSQGRESRDEIRRGHCSVSLSTLLYVHAHVAYEDIV